MEHRPDYLLWLNDDVVLQHDALGTLMAAMGGTDETNRCLARWLTL